MKVVNTKERLLIPFIFLTLLLSVISGLSIYLIFGAEFLIWFIVIGCVGVIIFILVSLWFYMLGELARGRR